jgi:hypothetical protein
VRIPKGLLARVVCKKVNILEVRILGDLEGPLGGHPFCRGTKEQRRLNAFIITHWYRLSIVTYKWFVCYGMAVGAQGKQDSDGEINSPLQGWAGIRDQIGTSDAPPARVRGERIAACEAR